MSSGFVTQTVIRAHSPAVPSPCPPGWLPGGLGGLLTLWDQLWLITLKTHPDRPSTPFPKQALYFLWARPKRSRVGLECSEVPSQGPDTLLRPPASSLPPSAAPVTPVLAKAGSHTVTRVPVPGAAFSGNPFMWQNESEASIRKSFSGNETSVEGRPDVRSLHVETGLHVKQQKNAVLYYVSTQSQGRVRSCSQANGKARKRKLPSSLSVLIQVRWLHPEMLQIPRSHMILPASCRSTASPSRQSVPSLLMSLECELASANTQRAGSPCMMWEVGGPYA